MMHDILQILKNMGLLKQLNEEELVEKAGFSSISSVKITGDHMYKISAVRESDKKELDVTVNAKTGKIDVEQAWWNIF